MISHYTINVARSGATIAERQAPEAAARIAGSEADWIEALGPGADRAGLQVAGNERLATSLLDGLSASAQRASRAA